MKNEAKEFRKKQYFRKLERNINIIKKNYNDISAGILRGVMSDSGEAVIDVQIKNKEELYHAFSDKSQINPLIYDYIESMVYPVSASVPVKIVINSNGVSKEEQCGIKRLIQNYYILILCDKQQDYELNLIKGGVLLAAGFLFMFLYVFLDRIFAAALILEIASIAATFSLWEAVDCFFLKRRELSINRLNAGQLATSEITFSGLV